MHDPREIAWKLPLLKNAQKWRCEAVRKASLISVEAGGQLSLVLPNLHLKLSNLSNLPPSVSQFCRAAIAWGDTGNRHSFSPSAWPQKEHFVLELGSVVVHNLCQAWARISGAQEGMLRENRSLLMA